MDVNVLAFKVVQRATDESKDNTENVRRSKSAAGFAGGLARAKSLSPQERREIALKANRARWHRKKKRSVRAKGE